MSAPRPGPSPSTDSVGRGGIVDATARFVEELGLSRAPDLSRLSVSDKLRVLVPREFARRHRLFPLSCECTVLRVAVADPLETEGLDTLAQIFALEIEPLLSTESEICAAIEQGYGSADEADAELSDEFSAGKIERVDEHEFTGTEGETANEADAPVVKLVHEIILEAIERRASDIHLEPLEKRFRVRYRIDGVLIEARNPPKRLQLATISRLKILANISIAEKRLPQDGRIQISVDGRQLDLRVSSMPTAHGESIVMRILDGEGLKIGLTELGFFPDDQETLRRLITLADGIVLVTGPTGSGKTTTLYSCLHSLNHTDRKIITVEDPVEYQLSGVNQVPVRPDVGLTFASALRAMLRQAPNVVMVGEIRDQETAEIAINASMTGHLVFSTLHTNDAPGAVTRLVDIGVKPFLVSSALRATLAQRLVRRICERCRQPYVPSAWELTALGISPEQASIASFARGAGCTSCHETGFSGRICLVEIFLINDELQRMIYDRATTAQLREKARALGMRTLREDGARKVAAGLTTFDEVLSLTLGDAN